MKWTERRDGNKWATLSLSLHVPRPMVEWILDHSDDLSNEADAVGFVTRWASDLTDEWHVLYADDVEVGVVHVDNVEDDCEVYDGPMPVMGRTTRRRK